MATQRVNETERNYSYEAFNGKDSKGRVIGVRVMTMELDMVEFTGRWGGYSIEPGHYFVAQVQATRNGEVYGATQGTSYFKTDSERSSYISKRVADSRKKAEK